MSKNIVICCDGTGNEIEEDLSNVLKLYQIADRKKDQVAFYDPGIGTIGRQNGWSKFKDKFKEFAHGATGYGLDQNVLDAYGYLARTYEEGDKIYLFGFSRGAYTVRVLAGFIRALGLMQPEQLNLAPYALKWYKDISFSGEFKNIWRFSEVTKARDISIHFMGVWDTVSSVFRPVPKISSFGLTKKKFAYTVNNSAIKTVRHAVAIDEKRKPFKADLWGNNKEYKSNRFSKSPKSQDVKEVWFAGVHSDVGGGYPESESGLAKIALKWMLVEATEAGLLINEDRYKRLVLGAPSSRSNRVYKGPDPHAEAHNSYTMPIRLAGSHRRVIPKGALVHETVKERLTSTKVKYAPKNLFEDKVCWESDRDLAP